MEKPHMESDYKSPLKKLVKFFEKSRDKWKVRALKSSEDIIRFKNRIKFLESSKAKVISENKALKEKLSLIEEELKKNSDPYLNATKHTKTTEQNLPSHRYTVSTILSWILFVTKG